MISIFVILQCAKTMKSKRLTILDTADYRRLSTPQARWAEEALSVERILTLQVWIAIFRRQKLKLEQTIYLLASLATNAKAAVVGGEGGGDDI